MEIKPEEQGRRWGESVGGCQAFSHRGVTEVAAVTTAVMLRQEHMHIHSCTHIKFPNGLPTRPPSANSLRQKKRIHHPHI